MNNTIKQQIIEFITTNFLFDEENKSLFARSIPLLEGIIDSTASLNS